MSNCSEDILLNSFGWDFPILGWICGVLWENDPQTKLLKAWTPKRRILAQIRMGWATVRNDNSIGLVCGGEDEKLRRKEGRKVTRAYISRVCGGPAARRQQTNFGYLLVSRTKSPVQSFIFIDLGVQILGVVKFHVFPLKTKVVLNTSHCTAVHASDIHRII